ncbi:hypothetical protein CRV00_07725 [Malaciobacter molluscorum]|nr:hypothetical protein CRV00_07725 [Malaciobacter molluscorum]
MFYIIMIQIKELEYNLEKLEKLTTSRDSIQGLKIYKDALTKLKQIKRIDDFHEILNQVLKALSGIEAHGFFTDEEYEYVTKIRKIKRRD